MLIKRWHSYHRQKRCLLTYPRWDDHCKFISCRHVSYQMTNWRTGRLFCDYSIGSVQRWDKCHSLESQYVIASVRSKRLKSLQEHIMLVYQQKTEMMRVCCQYDCQDSGGSYGDRNWLSPNCWYAADVMMRKDDSKSWYYRICMALS